MALGLAQGGVPWIVAPYEPLLAIWMLMSRYGPLWASPRALVGPPLGHCWASARALRGPPLNPCWASPSALVGPALGPCGPSPGTLLG